MSNLYDVFVVMYKEVADQLPANTVRARYGNLRSASDETIDECIVWLRERKAKELKELKDVIGCMSAERWEYYRTHGMTYMEEYVLRNKKEAALRRAWSETMPDILRPKSINTKESIRFDQQLHVEYSLHE